MERGRGQMGYKVVVESAAIFGSVDAMLVEDVADIS